MSTKISEFITITSVDDNGFLNVVQNGQNFKISQQDYLAQFGVTGSIVQTGSVSGTAILDIDGTVNKIRNVEDGPGILSGVSPENGLTLAHNFLRDQVGQEIFINPTEQQPKFVSLLQGEGISISRIDDHLTIAVSELAATTKTVVVNEITDFPSPSGGVITLASDTDYFLTNDMSTADRFVMGDNCQIRSAGTVIVTLTYTGSGAMFSCEDCNVRYRNITFSFSSGSAFDVTSSTAAGIGIVFADNVVFIGDTFGTAAARIFTVANCGLVFTSQGITSTAATMDVFAITSCTWIQFAGTCMDLGTTVSANTQAENLFVTISAGVTFLDGLVDSGNITTTGEGLMGQCRFVGLGTVLNNIDPDDNLWIFIGNNSVRNTMRDGIVSVQGNGALTTIGSTGVGVKVAGTFTVGRNSGYTPDTSGTITYDLLKDVIAPITASLSIQMDTGGAKEVAACIAINGTVVADSCISTSTTSSTSSNISLTWQEELEQDDFVEVFVQNDTDTVDILVTSMVLRVN